MNREQPPADALQQLKDRFTPQPLHLITAEPQVLAARFSPCGTQLVAGGFDGRVRRWDAEDAEWPELPALEAHQGWVEGLAMAGELLLTADSWGRLCAWPYRDEAPRPRWTREAAHDGWIRQLDVSPDGQWVASCGRDRHVRLWSVEEGRPGPPLPALPEDLFSVRFHPDGRSLLAGDLKGTVHQWELPQGPWEPRFDASDLYLYHRIQDVGGARVLAFDASGGQLAVGGVRPKNGATVQGEPTVLMFDTASGERLRSLALGAAKDCLIHDLQLHAEQFLLAVTSGTPGTGQLRLQRWEDDEPFFLSTKLANCHSLSLHPDGRRMAVAATNKGSNGNGRRLDQDGQYPGNSTPIQIFEFPG